MNKPQGNPFERLLRYAFLVAFDTFDLDRPNMESHFLKMLPQFVDQCHDNIYIK